MTGKRKSSLGYSSAEARRKKRARGVIKDVRADRLHQQAVRQANQQQATNTKSYSF